MKRSSRDVAILSLLAILIFVIPGRGLSEKLSCLKVEYHAVARQGSGMGPFYKHGQVLVQMAIDGNDHALMVFLNGLEHCDGANSYTQFNFLIDALRGIDDARFARVASGLDESLKERYRFMFTYVLDIRTQRPLTVEALDFHDLPDQQALPLHDPHLMWP